MNFTPETLIICGTTALCCGYVPTGFCMIGLGSISALVKYLMALGNRSEESKRKIEIHTIVRTIILKLLQVVNEIERHQTTYAAKNSTIH